MIFKTDIKPVSSVELEVSIMKRFSVSYGSFEAWKKASKDTTYKRKIERAHALHPGATLSQLRGHAKKGEQKIGRTKKVATSKLDWDILSPTEKELRERSYQVLRLMRNKGHSLTKASKEVGISPKAVIRNTDAFNKGESKWIPKKFDKIPRRMRINSEGKSYFITVNNSKQASTIGKYNSVVREFLEKGDEKTLRPFKGKRVKDIYGQWHTLETDPETIYEIRERRVNEEFYTIYQQG